MYGGSSSVQGEESTSVEMRMEVQMSGRLMWMLEDGDGTEAFLGGDNAVAYLSVNVRVMGTGRISVEYGVCDVQ